MAPSSIEALKGILKKGKIGVGIISKCIPLVAPC